MFGISYNIWKTICEMYFSLSIKTKKAYLQWFPFSKLSDIDENEIKSEAFYKRYMESGGFVFFPEVMRYSKNFILKGDGSFRNSSLISPILYLILQSIGLEISQKYISMRPEDIDVFYAGNYKLRRAKYKKDYDDFSKAINAGKEKYRYFIKTDVTNFLGTSMLMN